MKLIDAEQVRELVERHWLLRWHEFVALLDALPDQTPQAMCVIRTKRPDFYAETDETPLPPATEQP